MAITAVNVSHFTGLLYSVNMTSTVYHSAIINQKIVYRRLLVPLYRSCANNSYCCYQAVAHNDITIVTYLSPQP